MKNRCQTKERETNEKFLQNLSSHPPGLKNGFIKGEALTLLRTNSSKTFEESLVKFKQHLRTRGYPKTVIEKFLSGVSFAARPSALT